jgi:hypothetical protein
MAIEPGAYVRVDWVDAVCADDPADATKLEPMEGVAVGHFILTCGDHVNVALESFSDGTHRRVLSIPSQLVTRITELVAVDD